MVPDGAVVDDGMFELAMRASGVAYYEWHAGTDELHVSAALRALFGDEPGVWTEQRVRAAMHPGDEPDYRAARIGYFKGDAERSAFAYRIRIPGGGYRWVCDQTVVQRDADGRVTRLVGAISDITEGKLREAELEGVGGIPDSDRRCAEGHQPVDRSSRRSV